MAEYNKSKLRADFAQFIQLGTVEDYTLWGWGVGTSGLSYEIDEEDTQYVTQRVPMTLQKNYKMNQDVEEIVYTDNPIFNALDEIRKTRAINEKATGKMLLCNLYEEEDVRPTKCSAEEYGVIITITDFATGDAGDPLSISYSIKYQTEPTFGVATFDWVENTVTFEKGTAESSEVTN